MNTPETTTPTYTFHFGPMNIVIEENIKLQTELAEVRAALYKADPDALGEFKPYHNDWSAPDHADATPS